MARLIGVFWKLLLHRDVGGCEDAKEQLMGFVEALKNLQQRIGSRAQVLHEGVILNGRPGTGKTLLAKATASEANVPFITIYGREFRETVGLARMRDMFAKARKKAPCILFIDEIDAIGRQRSGDQLDRSEQKQVLTQLLREMDGLRSDEANVLVMAATNRIDILDEALLRPGRFDSEIFVPAPDIDSREAIFDLHLQRFKVDLNEERLSRQLAYLTFGFTGADIANACNEAASIAARDMKEDIIQEHFHEPIVTRKLTPKELKILAFQEAGRVVAGCFLKHAGPPLKFTIIPGGRSLRDVQYLPKIRSHYTIEQLLDRTCMALGGCLAEEIFFPQKKCLSVVAQNGLEEATQIAHSMVIKYRTSDKVAQLIDQEIQELVNKSIERTRQLFSAHKEDVKEIAGGLMNKETLTQAHIWELLRPRFDFFWRTDPSSRTWEVDRWLPKELESWYKLKEDINEQEHGK